MEGNLVYVGFKDDKEERLFTIDYICFSWHLLLCILIQQGFFPHILRSYKRKNPHRHNWK